MSAIVVNRWLKANDYLWAIRLSSKPTGIDGEIVGEIDGPRNVEFKSSGSKHPSYQFHPEFDYTSHGCLVFIQLMDGIPKRIFLVIGEKSITSIRSMAELDMKRRNFRVDDTALIHTTSKPASTQRPDEVDGLVDLVGRAPSDTREHCVVVIEGAQLDELLAQS